MAIYSLGMRITSSGNDVPVWAVQAAAGSEPTVHEVRWSNASAAFLYIGLGRSANIPAFGGNAVNLLPEDYARPPGLTTAAVAFTTAPTKPANFFRRNQNVSGQQNMGVVWVFTRGLVLEAAGRALTLWHIVGGTSSIDIDCVVDE